MFWALIATILSYEFTTTDISLFLAGCVGTFLVRHVYNRFWRQVRPPSREPRAPCTQRCTRHPFRPCSSDANHRGAHRCSECALGIWQTFGFSTRSEADLERGEGETEEEEECQPCLGDLEPIGMCGEMCIRYPHCHGGCHELPDHLGSCKCGTCDAH